MIFDKLSTFSVLTRVIRTIHLVYLADYSILTQLYMFTFLYPGPSYLYTPHSFPRHTAIKAHLWLCTAYSRPSKPSSPIRSIIRGQFQVKPNNNHLFILGVWQSELISNTECDYIIFICHLGCWLLLSLAKKTVNENKNWFILSQKSLEARQKSLCKVCRFCNTHVTSDLRQTLVSLSGTQGWFHCTLKYYLTMFTWCRHILKTVKNVTVAEFELAFTRCQNNLKTVRDLTVRNSLQDFDAIERYLHPKCQSVLFQKCRKLFYFQNSQMFTRCRFQNVLVRVQFSKSIVFKMWRQKMCRFPVKGRPIRHIFHRFQNVPASYERGLSLIT